MEKCLSFIFLFLLISCESGKKQTLTTSANYEEIEEIRIDTENGTFYYIDSLFSGKVSFVKLETTDDVLIGKISNILFDDNLIFVIDEYQTKSIFIFDMDGKCLSKISNFGNGPGEYSLMHNVFLIKDKKEIVVVDTPQRKRIHYSYSGKFISEDRQSFPAINCEYLESGYRAYYISDLSIPNYDNPANNSLVVTDENDKIVYSACNEFQSEDFKLHATKYFWNYGADLYFCPDWQNTLFLITDTAAIAKYHINIIPNEIPPPAEIKGVTTESFLKDYLNKYPFFDGCFVEYKDLTYLELINPRYRVIYSHKTKNTYLLLDEINTLYHFFDTPKGRYGDNTVVVPTLPSRILRRKQFLYEDVPRSRKGGLNIKEADRSFLDSLYQNLDEEDNPVLFFYELNANLQ